MGVASRCGEQEVGVASRCGEQEVGVASGSGWNLWVWLLGVVVRRYIDFLILLIPTPLVSVVFAAASLLFVHKKMFFCIYGTGLKNVIKTVRSVCVARGQRFPKNGIKRSIPFRSVPLHGPFHFDGLPLPGFLATDPDSINL